MSYAKDGEDMWLLEQFPPGFTGYGVELGAVDGTFISCTKLLEERGWNILCIEPNPRHQQALRACRKNVLTCACSRFPDSMVLMYEHTGIEGGTLSSMDEGALKYWGYGQGTTKDWKTFGATVLTLDQCLMVSNFPRLDVLVLDVDGRESDIIEGLDIDKWKPKAVIVEGGGNDGDRRERLMHFLERGYEEVGVKQDDNRLLVRKDV